MNRSKLALALALTASAFAFSASASETAAAEGTAAQADVTKFNFTRDWSRPHASQATQGYVAAPSKEAPAASREAAAAKADAVQNDNVADYTVTAPKKFRLTRGWDRANSSAANQA